MLHSTRLHDRTAWIAAHTVAEMVTRRMTNEKNKQQNVSQWGNGTAQSVQSASSHLDIDCESLWVSARGMNIILPNNVPSFGVFMYWYGEQSDSPTSPSCVPLEIWSLQIIQWPNHILWMGALSSSFYSSSHSVAVSFYLCDLKPK